MSLREGDGLWIDVREFERLAPDRPDAALELCRGELLEGFEDEWALVGARSASASAWSGCWSNSPGR